MAQIILHHYPASPVSEKVRTGLGLKRVTWYSAEQNRLPDRLELFAMTGGYRRIRVNDHRLNPRHGISQFQSHWSQRMTSSSGFLTTVPNRPNG